MQVLEEKVQDAEDAEAVIDVNIRWTTPAKPEPNVQDPAWFAERFEEENKDQVLYYTKSTMDAYLDMYNDLC